MDKAEQKTGVDDTFLAFGDTSNIGIEKQDNTVVIQMDEIIDFSAKSLEEICQACGINLISEETQINKEKILVKNRYVCFYEGTNPVYGEVSSLILTDLQLNKQDFGNLLFKLKKINDLNLKCNLKLLGITLQENSAILIFENVSTNLLKKLSEQQTNENTKYLFMFFLIEFISKLHEVQISLIDLREDTILFDKNDLFKFLIPLPEFKKLIKDDIEEDTKFNRLSSPELIQEKPVGIENDIWVVGCLFVEIFSAKEVWSGITEDSIKEDLKKNYVPKIHADIPKTSWGVICECLNPFPETRIDAKELLYKYSVICKKLNIMDIISQTNYYIEVHQKILIETTILNQSSIEGMSGINQTMNMENLNHSIIHQEEKKEEVLDNLEPDQIRKCTSHPKYEAFLFCAQCNDILCENCRKASHASHSDKGVIYEYLEFINIARNRTHTYKERFEKYIEACNIPKTEAYEANLKLTEDTLEKLYLDQKIKIEEQFAYLYQKLEETKAVEIENLTKYKNFFMTINSKNKENYDSLIKEIQSVDEILKNKEEKFLKFQNLPQQEKEDVMKNVSKDEITLSNKKKNIIRYISNFQKENAEVYKVRRYYETFIEKYKENKTTDLVKVVEKKLITTRQKYESIDVNEYLVTLKHEFEQIQILSSRNYFSTSHPKELYISVVNTNKIFSYNIDTDKYSLTEIDFKGMPISKFPNYSRSIIINGNLLVNGGYSDEQKAALPYFFFYDKNNKTLTRFTDMLYGHSAHSIIFIPPHYVVVVSGSGIRKCEKYNMESNSWEELPEISIPRQNTTLYYHNKQYLYSFGGAYWDDKDKAFAYLSTVERLDMGFGSIESAKEWEAIKTYQLSNNLNIRKSVMTAISYNSSKLLLIGGSIGTNIYSDECLLFDFDKNEFSKKENIVLPKKTCFPHKFFMYYGNKCYQLDNDGHVYAFDFSLEKFYFVKENNTKSK